MRILTLLQLVISTPLVLLSNSNLDLLSLPCEQKTVVVDFKQFDESILDEGVVFDAFKASTSKDYIPDASNENVYDYMSKKCGIDT